MIYDKIYVGSGPILMLDAINSFLGNEKVLIIDKSNKLGGAWKSIVLFDGNEVENAVHYLLPNEKGYSFLKYTFKVDIAKCKKKFYAINFLNRRRIISINNYLGKFIYTLNGGDQAEFFSFKSIKNFSLKQMNKNSIKMKYPINPCSDNNSKCI